MLILVGALGIGGFPFVVLLPIFADRIFQRGASGLGWLMTAIGCGALLGALFLAGRKGLKGISRVISLCSIGFSISLMLFGLSPHFQLSLLFLCCVGFFMMITVASINTAIQSMIPDSLRGRVMSLFTTMLIGTAPVGSLIAGAVAKYVEAPWTIFMLALVCLTAGFWFYRSVPEIIVEARRLVAEQAVAHDLPVTS
jgi:MFS family permease